MAAGFAGIAAAVWWAAAPVFAQETAAAAQDDAPFHLLAAEALAHGRDADAEALAAARDPDDPEAAAVLARLLIARGRYEEAEARLAPMAADAPQSAASLELALLWNHLGRRGDARPHLNAVIARAQRSRQAIDLYRGGMAARALGEFRLANSLLRAAAAGAPSDPGIQTTWGELFLEKYNQSDALRSFGDALAIDNDWVPALLGRARALASDNPPGARQAVARALTIDSDNAEAHLIVAGLELDGRNRVAAREAIDRALATNPRSLEARALLAAIAFLEDRTEDFEAEVQRAQAINPVYGDVYRIAAVHTAGAYRFPEAVGLARRAVELDPGNTRAHAELGLYLLRTGDEPAARASLERSFADDPFDVMTFNLLAMMDTLDEFRTFERGDVIVRLHPDEAPVLGEYVLTLAQDALDVLSARYEMTIEGPILIEIFPRHDDFAVRTLGLPGMIGALGACFGRVVTMDSPRARPPGDFNWQSTLWHEIAHVITLQMSNQRLPRWLSEGISTYEEKRANRQEWATRPGVVLRTRLFNGEHDPPPTRAQQRLLGGPRPDFDVVLPGVDAWWSTSSTRLWGADALETPSVRSYGGRCRHRGRARPHQPRLRRRSRRASTRRSQEQFGDLKHRHAPAGERGDVGPVARRSAADRLGTARRAAVSRRTHAPDSYTGAVCVWPGATVAAGEWDVRRSRCSSVRPRLRHRRPAFGQPARGLMASRCPGAWRP